MPCSENLHDVCKKTTKQNAGSHTRIATGRTKKKSDSLTTVAQVLALPIFPGRHQPSIVGRDELNYRVRNGNGWTLALISTNSFIRVLPEEQTDYNVFYTLCQ